MNSLLKEGNNVIKPRILEKAHFIEEYRIWQGTQQNGYDLINVNVKTKDNIFVWKRFYVHKLLFLIENDKESIAEGYQLSHLCINSLSTRIDHLHEEYTAINKQRDQYFYQQYMQWTRNISKLYFIT